MIILPVARGAPADGCREDFDKRAGFITFFLEKK